MELKAGALLQGDKYRIVRTLGHGGFGITYLAHHDLADRKVCIKEFFPKQFYRRNEDGLGISLGTDGSAEMMEAYKQKFLKEARVIARLEHPNIIHIHDVFQENNTAYYVMDYVDGDALVDIIRKEGPLEEQRALRYVREVAAALEYIHNQHITHLDIKPANILMRSNGSMVLIDFGLSKQYDETGSQTSSTPVGISHGYAPIEQYQNMGVSQFSPESDIYSLGATLYALLMAKTPPTANEILDQGIPAMPQSISATTRNAIARAMQPRRRERPSTIAEFLKLLDGNVAHDTDTAPIKDNTTQAIEETQPLKPRVTAPKYQPKVTPKNGAKSNTEAKKQERIAGAWSMTSILFAGLTLALSFTGSWGSIILFALVGFIASICTISNNQKYGGLCLAINVLAPILIPLIRFILSVVAFF